MYKFLKKIKFNLNIFLVLILFLILCKSTDTFRKSYYIVYENINKRQENAYDFCDYTGTGYIFYIKNKFKIKKIPIIKNNFTSRDLGWIFHNSINGTDKSKIIVLNYTEEKLKEANFDKFKLIDNFRNRCFFLEKI